MKGRRTPPASLVVLLPVRDDDPSQEADSAYFTRYPERHAYVRCYIVGETPEPMPPGTMVLVQRIGAERARAFYPPLPDRRN